MDEVLLFLQNNPGPWGLTVLFCAAALEYMIPPFPADTVVLAGSLFVLAGTWSYPVVASTVILGGLVGSASHLLLGRMLLDGSGNLRGGRVVERLTGRGSLDRFFEAFRRHGMWVIAINRALPGIRGAAFLAAGAAKLPIVKTLGFGLISNILWSNGLLLIGLSIGNNWEKIEDALGVYQGVALAVAVVVLLFVAVRHRRKKLKAQQR